MRYGIGVGREGFAWAGVQKGVAQGRMARLGAAARDDPAPAISAALGRRRPGQSARRARHVSRQQTISHPRHQRPHDHRPESLERLRPADQRGRHRSLRARKVGAKVVVLAAPRQRSREIARTSTGVARGATSAESDAGYRRRPSPRRPRLGPVLGSRPRGPIDQNGGRWRASISVRGRINGRSQNEWNGPAPIFTAQWSARAEDRLTTADSTTQPSAPRRDMRPRGERFFPDPSGLQDARSRADRNLVVGHPLQPGRPGRPTRSEIRGLSRAARNDQDAAASEPSHPEDRPAGRAPS